MSMKRSGETARHRIHSSGVAAAQPLRSSPPDQASKVRATMAKPSRPEWETKMRTKLATERGSLSFAATPLPKALKLFCGAKGLEVTTEGKIPTDSVTFTVADLSLRQILDLLLVPRGCTYDVTKKGVLVKGVK